jgi:hypothetical protein
MKFRRRNRSRDGTALQRAVEAIIESPIKLARIAEAKHGACRSSKAGSACKVRERERPADFSHSEIREDIQIIVSNPAA